jgi:hypothetical protein
MHKHTGQEVRRQAPVGKLCGLPCGQWTMRKACCRSLRRLAALKTLGVSGCGCFGGLVFTCIRRRGPGIAFSTASQRNVEDSPLPPASSGPAQLTFISFASDRCFTRSLTNDPALNFPVVRFFTINGLARNWKTREGCGDPSTWEEFLADHLVVDAAVKSCRFHTLAQHQPPIPRRDL